MGFQVGDRVRWVCDEDDEPDNAIGTVRAPTPEELAYVATWSPTARAAITGHVIVAWDGDDQWDGAWCCADDLELTS